MKKVFSGRAAIFYVITASGLVCLSTLVVEFLYPFATNRYLALQSLLIISIWYVFIHLSDLWKSKLTKVSKVLLCVIFIAWIVQLVAATINIYRFELPAVFYQLKLFRLITLSGIFFIQPTLLFLGLIALSKPITTFALKWWQTLAVVGLVSIGLVQVQNVVAIMHQEIPTTVQALQLPFPDRHEMRLGGKSYHGWIWSYTRFIRKHTPPTAILVLPPMENDWKMEGNQDYIRWYFYPRTLLHLNQDQTLPVGSQYLLISKGECLENPCGWPRHSIPATQIKAMYLIDRETLEEKTLTDVSYEWEIYKDSWGLIELMPAM